MKNLIIGAQMEGSLKMADGSKPSGARLDHRRSRTARSRQNPMSPHEKDWLQ